MKGRHDQNQGYRKGVERLLSGRNFSLGPR